MISGAIDYSKVERFLDDLDGLNLLELHKNLGDTGRTIIEERFDTSTDPKGRTWKPLKRTYVRYQKKGKGGAMTKVIRLKSSPPLKFRDLYKSFSYDASEKEVRIGTPKDYAKYHSNFPSNNGGPRRVMPLREFLGFESATDQAALLDTVLDFIDAKTQKE
jgi:phage gpG-like protein